MRTLDGSDLLALWERGAARHALDRSVLLGSWARPDLPPDRIADLPLGTITTSLLRLREANFGARIESHLDCAHCGQRLEFDLHVGSLLQPEPDDARRSVEVAGLPVRAPCLRDLAAVADEPDPERAARALLGRCLRDRADAAATLSEGALRDIEDALEALDPNADLAFSVQCEACGRQSTAQLDAGALLWEEVDAGARALLADVHLLASAYGWSEREILALGPARRAAYLAMAAA